MRRKLFFATAFIAVATIAGAGIVFAAGAASWPTRGGAGGASVQSGGGSGSGCGTAWQTIDFPDAVFFPDTVPQDFDFDELTPASSVTFVKTCQGGAVATFSSETAAEQPAPPSPPGAQDIDNSDIAVVVRATCLQPFPGAGPCQTGDVVYGSPGGEDDPVFFDLAPDIHEAHSMQWALSSLKPGTWRVEVIPGTLDAEPNSWLEFRTLFVETL